MQREKKKVFITTIGMFAMPSYEFYYKVMKSHSAVIYFRPQVSHTWIDCRSGCIQLKLASSNKAMKLS